MWKKIKYLPRNKKTGTEKTEDYFCICSKVRLYFVKSVTIVIFSRIKPCCHLLFMHVFCNYIFATILC